MGVYFPRSTTTKAKFGQVLENGPRRLPKFWSGICGFDFQSYHFFFLFSTFCSSHSTENVFLNTLSMNDCKIILDEEMPSHIVFQGSVTLPDSKLLKSYSFIEEIIRKKIPVEWPLAEKKKKKEKKVSWRGVEPVTPHFHILSEFSLCRRTASKQCANLHSLAHHGNARLNSGTFLCTVF